MGIEAMHFPRLIQDYSRHRWFWDMTPTGLSTLLKGNFAEQKRGTGYQL